MPPTALPDVPTPALPAGDATRAAPPRPDRRPFRDNPRLILLGILVLLGALVTMVTLADRWSAEVNPSFLTEVVLYALSAADLTMLVALAFVLARNIIKLVVERRRGLPFSRFRAKLVGALLGLTIIPALLVLLVGSELIRSSTQKWVSQPVDAVLTSATQIAGEYYREREEIVTRHATALARSMPPGALRGGDVAGIRRLIEREVIDGRVRRIEVFALAGGQPVSLVAAQSPLLPRNDLRDVADRFASRVAAGYTGVSHEPLEGAGELVQAGAIVTDPATQQPVGIVIASDHLTGELAAASHRIVAAYEDYSKLRFLSPPLRGMYQSLFLMTTLMILVSATWMGLYLAKRITRPVHMLAEGAREIGAGHLDHRIEPETRDEFGALIEAFNAMAEELAASQRTLEGSRLDLQRKNLQLDERRRYIETVLERIATGVISIGPDGRIETVNGAALRLLDVDDRAIGMPADAIFARDDLKPLGALLRQARGGGGPATAHEIALAREGRDLHLAAAATPLHRDGHGAGAVLVFDDVTPLIRTQRVAAWRDVARRLAHEIKNPLTPIQLCAERLRRNFGTAPAPARDLVEECTSTIVGEVESLKGLVDEFAQFARMPAPRTVSTDLHAVLADALALYDGLFRTIRIDTRFDATLPPVRLDVEQIRRVAINLVDNAVEALGGNAADAGPNGALPVVVVATEHDRVHSVVRIIVSDNGPGISAADRDKLFMPYYSTKNRGSGLGLAIVRRIIVEHGGSIEVQDNQPHGTRFVIELPL